MTRGGSLLSSVSVHIYISKFKELMQVLEGVLVTCYALTETESE